MNKVTSRWAGVASALTGALLVGLAGIGPASASIPGAAPADAQPLPGATVAPVSQDQIHDGRYFLRRTGVRWELRDGQRHRRVKLLPSTAIDPDLSDDGRYVTYTVPGPRTYKRDPFGPMRRHVRVYDRKTGRTRSAATTASGKALKPTWKTDCTPDSCDESAAISRIPQLTSAEISGNGRYIVFCANYVQRDRADLYIKNWRTKKLQRIDGACQTHNPVADWDQIQRPSVNEDGSVILLPGRHSDGDDSEGCWEPSRALVNRNQIVEVGGRQPTMTHDGRLISSVGKNGGCAWDATNNQPVADRDLIYGVNWFDLNTMSGSPAEVTGLRLTTANSSRRGRFVAWFEQTYVGAIDPAGDAMGYANKQWLVLDRATGTRYDLGAAIRDAGYTPSTAGGDASATVPVMISNDGRTVYANTDRGWVAVAWARPA